MVMMMEAAMAAALGFVSKQTGNAKDKETQDDPYGIEHYRCLEDIKNGCPQLRDRRAIVDDGIDIQAYGYHEADEQRQQLGANSAGRNIKIRHYFNV